MSHFVGKWKSNNASRKNLDEFIVKTGIPKEYVDKYRDATTYEEYKLEGDNWIKTVTSDVLPQPLVYKFQLGKESVTKDPEGKGVKFTANITADGVWEDTSSSEMMGWKETKTRRVIKGNTMFATIETAGVKMSYEMDRQ